MSGVKNNRDTIQYIFVEKGDLCVILWFIKVIRELQDIESLH